MDLLNWNLNIGLGRGGPWAYPAAWKRHCAREHQRGRPQQADFHPVLPCFTQGPLDRLRSLNPSSGCRDLAWVSRSRLTVTPPPGRPSSARSTAQTGICSMTSGSTAVFDNPRLAVPVFESITGSLISSSQKIKCKIVQKVQTLRGLEGRALSFLLFVNRHVLSGFPVKVPSDDNRRLFSLAGVSEAAEAGVTHVLEVTKDRSSASPISAPFASAARNPQLLVPLRSLCPPYAPPPTRTRRDRSLYRRPDQPPDVIDDSAAQPDASN